MIQYYNDNDKMPYRLDTVNMVLDFWNKRVGKWQSSGCDPDAPLVLNWPKLTKDEAKKLFPDAF